jgi:hypothetical protein
VQPPPSVLGRSARVLAGKTVAGGDEGQMTALAGEKREREGGKLADEDEELDGGSVGGGSAAATARAVAAAAAAAVSARVRGDMRPFGAVLADARTNGLGLELTLTLAPALALILTLTLTLTRCSPTRRRTPTPRSRRSWRRGATSCA